MSVTRRGEKELRLAAFIARGLEDMGSRAESGPAREEARGAILALARSVRSPVVRAIVARAPEIATAGGAVRLILAKADDLAPSNAPAALASTGPRCEVRIARNPRLIEAHEQLTIAARIAWTGDTMRRDPSICDAYESFVEDCPELAAAATATFERLWADCMPLAVDGPLAMGGVGAPQAMLLRSALARRA